MASAELPLAGIRVLDLAGEMGAYGSRLLALAGAEVVKVEPPAGDRQRSRPLEFAYYHTGKRGLTLDPGAPDAIGKLAGLARDADVILVAPSRRAPTPGWDPDRRLLEWAGPDAVVCCLTSFGHGGPDDDLRATHLTSFALSGQMLALGPEAGPPRSIPTNTLYDELSAHAAAAALVALRARPQHGGQVIELSLHDLLAYRDSMAIAIFDHTRRVAQVRKQSAPQAPPTGVWETRDGQVEFLVYNPSHWDGFFVLAGRPPELADPELRSRAKREERADVIAPLVSALFESMTTEEVVTRAQELRVPVAPRLLPEQAATDRQLASRDFFQEYRHPEIGTFVAPGLPFISDPPILALPETPAPRLGEHNAEPLGGGRTAPPVGGSPIGELRVLSFGTAIAGNVSATVLAELGADVVKIESPTHPDPLRAGPISPWLPRVFEPSGVETTVMFSAYSRSCRSVALDMKNPEELATFLDLVSTADVLIDNFAGGVMDSWGISHRALAERNPRLVMVTVCGYGRTGPRSRYMAYGMQICSFLGLTRVWAQHGTQFDYTAVAHVVFAVLAGLANRDRTGKGMIVDISQVEAGAAMTAPSSCRRSTTWGSGRGRTRCRARC